MKKLLCLLALTAASAHAQDEFYSINPGDAAYQIGNFRATGFIETSGLGATTMQPGGIDVVGYDFTVTNGTYTANFCNNASGNAGCKSNDELALATPPGLVATLSGLYCDRCTFYDVGNGPYQDNWFLFSGTGNQYILATSSLPSTGTVTATNTINGEFAIAGGAPTTYNPVQAPEINWRGSIEAALLLMGGALVLKGRTRTRS